MIDRTTPDRIVYAPNYWQWFSHHKNHGTLPDEIAHCETQLDVISHLGLDVFSRNIYCDQTRRWFGGLAEECLDGGEITYAEHREGQDLVITRTYHTSKGALHERQRYVWNESTLVQEKFLIDDYASQMEAFEELVRARRWRFSADRYGQEKDRVGSDGIVVAGELHSPLKMLHLAMGPVETVYFISDFPEKSKDILHLHEQAQLDLVRQMTEAGVEAMMSMDNLDTAFHPPAYVEQLCASYYSNACDMCHGSGSTLFIHACGQQRENLGLISSLGVDGLEGVAYPPLGDVDLDEAMRSTSGGFIITGGISGMEFENLKSRQEIFEYTKCLLDKLCPYAHRFMFSASCNTPINAGWDAIRWFRDAWLEYGCI